MGKGSGVVQAGWYPDGRRAGWQRYWDGAAWTEQWRPDDADEVDPAPPLESAAGPGKPGAKPPSPLPPPVGPPISSTSPPPPPLAGSATSPPSAAPSAPRSTRSTAATTAIIAGGLFVLFTLFVVAGLAGAWDEPASDGTRTSPTQAASESPPAVASESATAWAEGSEPAAASEPDADRPGESTPTATVAAAHLAPDRLVIDDSPDLEVRAINELERSLADQLVTALEPANWWPLVGELYVEEDMFVSDVRVSLDVFAHPDTVALFVQVCQDVVAALPDTDAGLAVHVYATQVSGARDEIDGSTSDWELYYARPGLARGDNFSDEPCEDGDVDDATVQRVEEYLADQDG